MKISKLLAFLLHFYMPRIVGGEGGAIDRGDDFTPTGEDAEGGVEEIDKKGPEPKLEDVPKDEKKGAAKEEVKAEDPPKDEPKADEVKDKPKDTRIPAARHKEILDNERARREAVEVELAKYKQGTQIADVNAEIGEAETKLIDLEKAYAKQLSDGETDKAAATMTQIRRTERAINEKSAQMRETAAEARAVERVRFDVTVERLEEQFSQLNPDHDDFDRGKTKDVRELMEAYQLKGYTPSAALQKAVKLIMPPTTVKQEKALEVEARVDPKAVEAARKAAAAGKTAETVAKTPASAAKVGENSDKAGGGAVTAKDIIKMPYKDFTKVDDATLAAARGDVF